MTYQGSLEDEIRTAAAEAARDAETAEAYRRMVTQGETDARSAGATLCTGTDTCPSYATCRTGRPCNLLTLWDVARAVQYLAETMNAHPVPEFVERAITWAYVI